MISSVMAIAITASLKASSRSVSRPSSVGGAKSVATRLRSFLAADGGRLVMAQLPEVADVRADGGEEGLEPGAEPEAAEAARGGVPFEAQHVQAIMAAVKLWLRAWDPSARVSRRACARN